MVTGDTYIEEVRVEWNDRDSKFFFKQLLRLEQDKVERCIRSSMGSEFEKVGLQTSSEITKWAVVGMGIASLATMPSMMCYLMLHNRLH